MSLQSVHLSPAEFRARVLDLAAIYLRAMNYPMDNLTPAAERWRGQSYAPGFTAVMITDTAHPETPLGIAYRISGAPYHRMARMISRSEHPPQDTAPIITSYAEIAEVQVDPTAQGRGAGHLLLEALCHDVPDNFLVLSTPEAPEASSRAWRLYRSHGFRDIRRNAMFLGDARHFGILGRPTRADINWPLH